MPQSQSSPLAGRRVTLGVTGSIAAYKAAVLARRLRALGATLRVVLTRGGSQFVGESTFAGLTGLPVERDALAPGAAGERHVELARDSDLIVVAPATADFLARAATGRADDLLAATVLCARCPVVLAPAMHPAMWDAPATRRNVATLAADPRMRLVGPAEGEVASREVGLGRLVEPEDLAAAIVAALAPGDLAGRHLVVTAGPTVEDLDAVRFLSNRSSGKMGFAIAERAARRGARCTLVAGPVSLATPPGVDRVDVRSALDLERALGPLLRGAGTGADALVMAAAVGDFRVERPHPGKLKRGSGAGLTLRLVQNPDVLAGIGAARRGPRPLLVGFAVETGDDDAIIAEARRKLRQKRVDLVVANHAAESLGRGDNRVLLVGPREVEALPVLDKGVVADRILDRIARLLAPARAPARGRRR